MTDEQFLQIVELQRAALAFECQDCEDGTCPDCGGSGKCTYGPYAFLPRGLQKDAPQNAVSRFVAANKLLTDLLGDPDAPEGDDTAWLAAGKFMSRAGSPGIESVFVATENGDVVIIEGEWTKCASCGGTDVCSSCNGTGKCWSCGGAGTVVFEDTHPALISAVMSDVVVSACALADEGKIDAVFQILEAATRWRIEVQRLAIEQVAEAQAQDDPSPAGPSPKGQFTSEELERFLAEQDENS